MILVHQIDGSPPESLDEFEAHRLEECTRKAFTLLQDIRFNLGIVLEYSDTSGQDPYIRWKKTFKFQDKLEPVEESDASPTFPSSYGRASSLLMTLAGEIEDREIELKEFMDDFNEYYLSGWIYEHFKEAIVDITKVRCYLRTCSALLSYERGSTEEGERSNGSADEILSRDSGFQISARAG